MGLARPLRYMLMVICFTTVYLIVMLDRWSERTKVCRFSEPPPCSVNPAEDHQTQERGYKIEVACKCDSNNSDYEMPTITTTTEAVVVKQEGNDLRSRRHINYFGPNDPQAHPSPRQYTEKSQLQIKHERLAGKLSQLQDLLAKLEKHIESGLKVEEIKWAIQTVRDVISLLNTTSPQLHPSSLGKDYTVISKSTLEDENKSHPVDVCPEVYKGTVYGYPFYEKGFETMECKGVKPFKDVISAVFNFANYPTKYRSAITEIVKSFARQYPGVPLYIAVSEEMFSDEINSLPAQVEIVRRSMREGVVWNRLIAQVETPYTFLAKGVVAFNQDGRLERLVRAISTVKVPIAGGAIRTPDGLWNTACHQAAFRNYTVIYRQGYHYSRHECVFCSHITGPFVARTGLLHARPLDENLDGRVLLEDYLFNLSRQGLEMVVCSDSMFYVLPNEKERYHKSVWLPFARKWRINHLKFPQSGLLTFTCEELYSDCSFITGLAVPPCCLQLLAEQIKFIMRTCEKHNVFCELQEGTLLGAVKLNKVLPWERDGDITFLSSNFSALQKLKETFAVGGYTLTAGDKPRCCEEGRLAGGTFNVRGIGTPWNVEMYGQHKMDSEVLVTKGLKPSKVLFHGAWVTVPRNPGLHVRNRYGPEVFRHAQHWISLGKYNGWEVYDITGFTQCPVPGRHDCLDQFVADGNLQFEDPVP